MRYFLLLMVMVFSFAPHAAAQFKLLAPKFCYVEKQNSIKCAELPPKYQFLKNDILNIIKLSPPLVKKIFHTLKKVKITKSFNEDWVSGHYNKRRHELVIGANFLNETYLKKPKYRPNGRQKQHANWKRISNEPKNYGDETKSINFYLAKILLHEIGHSVDYLYLKSNAFSCANEKLIQKDVMIDSIIKLSVPYKKDYCKKIYDVTSVYKVFKQLSQSQFVSLYATCTVGEDFAETFSDYILNEYLKFNLKIKNDGKLVYDLSQRLAHKNMKHKLQTVKVILALAKLDNPSLKQAIDNHKNCAGSFKIK